MAFNASQCIEDQNVIGRGAFGTVVPVSNAAACVKRKGLRVQHCEADDTCFDDEVADDPCDAENVGKAFSREEHGERELRMAGIVRDIMKRADRMRTTPLANCRFTHVRIPDANMLMVRYAKFADGDLVRVLTRRDVDVAAVVKAETVARFFVRRRQCVTSCDDSA